ncbi:MAG TPA: hypothetical protein VNU01_08405 [Egibacteraceae bacterium]|nr:hypothetical protein [Egibacteraceae bacterium]
MTVAQSEEYATKEDLHRVEDRLERGVTDLRAEIATARQESKADNQALRAEMAAGHDRLREDITSTENRLRDDAAKESQKVWDELKALGKAIDNLRRDGMWFGLTLAGVLATIEVIA